MTLLQEHKNIVSSRGKSRDLTTSILQTLKYSDHFGFSLTQKEIHLRLISSNPCSLERVIGTLYSMKNNKQIEKTQEYYHLPGRSSLVARRLSHVKFSVPQLARAKSFAIQLGHIPGVLAVYLTGSLAMSNSNIIDDIDFMIIAKNKRLWTTRLLLTIYTELLGLRRRPYSTKTSGKICLNLYLSPSSYRLPTAKQSLYTAYELLQAVPLYDPLNTRSDLLAANPWMRDYLPNFPLPKGRLLDRRRERISSRDAKGGRRLPIGIFGTLESLLYHLQLFYMKSKITREYITEDTAFFHPNNPASKVLKKLSL